MKLLIVGCGCSGNSFASDTLQQVGLQVGHEEEAKNGSVDWRAVAWEPAKIRKYDLVLHQVRHPLHVIASWHNVNKTTWKTVGENMRLRGSTLRKSMQYWLYWNRRAMLLAHKTYRVEEFLKVMPTILKGYKIGARRWKALKNTGEKVNSREGENSYRKDVTWELLEAEDPKLARDIRNLAKRYGYDV